MPGGLLDAFDARLPFTLTAGQRAVGAEIAADLAGEHPMNRLVQGDVGAGKTVVALRAMLQVVDSGRQAAMLAPTEVLAAQHARSLRSLLGPLAQAGELGGAEQATRVTLLRGRCRRAAKRRRCWRRSPARPGIVVGTHALIQDRVGFAELGLVVVDEQHRFGVEQRDALRGRGERAPHLLVMTATPIPRTVAMTVYGDLEVSALRELPGGRSPIATTVVPAGEKPAWLERVWRRIREEVAAGHQVYVVCPRVGGDTAKDDTEFPRRPGSTPVPARDERRGRRWRCSRWHPKLAEGPLAGLRLGVLHGKLPPDEKDAVMRAFDAGELDVLVATTVIEVGRRRAELHGDGDPRRRPLRPVPAAPAARAGRPRVGARGVPAGHRHAGAAPRPASGSTRWRAPPTASSWPAWTSSCAGRATSWARCSRAAAPGCGCCRCCATRRSSPRRAVYATEIVDGDPAWPRHPGLRALVAETVGDEERAAYLDKV